MLQVERVTKRFGGLVALNRVSFEVAEGQVLGLIGPNGSGKSTMFGVLSGFHHPEEGRVTFRGQDITHLKPHKIARLGVGRTFQIAQPLPEFTCLDTVALGIFYGTGENSLSQARRLAEPILDFVGLGDKALSRSADLTLVDLRKLELARALSIRPKLLLLDEVFAGLTPGEIQGAVTLIRRIHGELGMTMIVTEHILPAVMQTCERVIVLDQGQIIASGTPEQVARDPRVAEVYLGTLEAGGVTHA